MNMLSLMLVWYDLLSFFPRTLISFLQILSRKHVLAAVFRAMNDYLSDRLKSRNIHSEIVFALSPNNNVSPQLWVIQAETNITQDRGSISEIRHQ